LAKKSDSQITQDVLDEIFWDPAVTVADLSASTSDHRVTLMGTTATYGEKLEAEDAAYRVAGVRDVDNDITVDPSAFGMRSDDAIANDVRSALILDYEVPDDRINVSVFEGTDTLTGTVDWYYQSEAAEEDAAMIKGVKYVDNMRNL
jgi:osmotically-inducible protein OsmY